MTHCVICNNLLSGIKRKYCSNKCKGKDTNNIHQNYEKQKDRALTRKLCLINDKGGKCEKCGYNNNSAALCFHHLDPTQKEYGIDSRQCSNRTLESLKIEAAKCILLCANCHMEIHYPDLTGNLSN